MTEPEDAQRPSKAKYALFDQGVEAEEQTGVPGDAVSMQRLESGGGVYSDGEGDELKSIYEEESAVEYAQRQRRRRRWWWLGVAACILVVVFVVILVASVLVGSADGLEESGAAAKGKATKAPVLQHEAGSGDPPRANKGKDGWIEGDRVKANALTRSGILISGLYPQQFVYSWDFGSGNYTILDQNSDLISVDAEGSERIVAHRERLLNPEGIRFYPESWEFSHDNKFILFKTSSKKRWRYSETSDYLAFDIEKQMTSALTLTGERATTQVAAWSPTGHHVAFVRNNDLFVSWNLEHEIRLTDDGSDLILNGVADWVYEEEVFSGTKAFWWAPDGTNLVYLKTNDTRVRSYSLPYYFDREKGGHTQQYSDDFQLKYPKPGYPNPAVTLHVAALGAPTGAGRDNEVPPGVGKEIKARVELTRQIKLPEHSDDPIIRSILEDDSHIYAKVDWVTRSSDRFVFQLLNRQQDKSVWYTVDTSKFTAEAASQGSQIPSVRVERVEHRENGWFDPQYVQGFRYLRGGTKGIEGDDTYVHVTVHPDNGFEHIALYELGTPEPKRWLTSGNWTVLADSVAINHDLGRIFFAATPDGPATRSIHFVDLSGKVGANPTRVTPEQEVAYYESDFSPENANTLILAYKGPGLGSWRVCDAAKDDVLSHCRSLMDSETQERRLSKYAVPTKELHTLELDGYSIPYTLYLPPGLDKAGDPKYPVIFHVYGGPDSQQVTYEWDLYKFRSTMSSALGVVVCVVDPRGTGFLGRDYRFAVKHHLGKHETEDVIAVARHIQGLPFVASDNIGIWGWSYGGFLTTKVVEANPGIFTTAVAVAPVTDWRYYDTIYTERYMGTPEENEEGYEESAVSITEGFLDAKFLVCHGTGDDNVHLQNTLSLLRKLVADGVDTYQVLIYPDSHHSMEFEGAVDRMYHRIERFFNDGFENS